MLRVALTFVADVKPFRTASLHSIAVPTRALPLLPSSALALSLLPESDQHRLNQASKDLPLP